MIEPVCQNKSSRNCKAVASVSPGSLLQRSLVPLAKQNLLMGPWQAPFPPWFPWKQGVPQLPWPAAAQSKDAFPWLPWGSPCEHPVQFPSCPKRGVVCLLPPSSQDVECEYIKAIRVNLGCAVTIRAVGVDRACLELSFQPWGRRGAGDGWTGLICLLSTHVGEPCWAVWTRPRPRVAGARSEGTWASDGEDALPALGVPCSSSYAREKFCLVD